jgi:hypothetical protein
VAEAQKFASSIMLDTATIAELRQRLRTANYAPLVGTPNELAAGLVFLCNSFPDGYLGRLQSQVIRSRGAITDCRSNAKRVLGETAADRQPDSELVKLGANIEETQRRIAARRPTLQAEELIKQQRALCERLAGGGVSPPYTPGQPLTADAKLSWIKQTYRAARVRLDQLIDLVSGKADAEKQNASDQAELARLQAKVMEVQQSALLRMCKPEAMRWVGDE